MKSSFPTESGGTLDLICVILHICCQCVAGGEARVCVRMITPVRKKKKKKTIVMVINSTFIKHSQTICIH